MGQGILVSPGGESFERGESRPASKSEYSWSLQKRAPRQKQRRRQHERHRHNARVARNRAGDEHRHRDQEQSDEYGVFSRHGTPSSSIVRPRCRGRSERVRSLAADVAIIECAGRPAPPHVGNHSWRPSIRAPGYWGRLSPVRPFGRPRANAMRISFLASQSNHKRAVAPPHIRKAPICARLQRRPKGLRDTIHNRTVSAHPQGRA